MKEIKGDSIRVVDIILSQSNFKRQKEVIDAEKLKNFVNIDINIEEFENELYVKEILTYEGKIDDKIVIDSVISMVGIFLISGEKPTYYEEFKKVNAPAIIFPFIREHLNSLTNKSGIFGINLPPFNFVAFSNKYFSEKRKELNNSEN